MVSFRGPSPYTAREVLYEPNPWSTVTSLHTRPPTLPQDLYPVVLGLPREKKEKEKVHFVSSTSNPTPVRPF